VPHGRNGVGKTRCSGPSWGSLPVRSGRVTFDGTTWAADGRRERAFCGIGYVPQGREIFRPSQCRRTLRHGHGFAAAVRGKATATWGT